jgi:hypothetical protein
MDLSSSVCSNITESDTRHLGISQAEKQDFIEEVNTELSMYYAILYFMVEVMKGDEDFGDELSTWCTSLLDRH